MTRVPPISMLPVLGQTVAPTRSRSGELPTRYLMHELNALYLPSGRSAIGLGLERLGIGAGDEVLVPAYHCPSMIDPLRWLGIVPRYYSLDDQFEPRLDHLTSLITPRTRAVIAAHLFAIPLDLSALAALCRARDLALIEDCAHTLFYHEQQTAPGALGTCAIASPRKYFPVRDGGVLMSSNARFINIPLRPAPLRYELKMAYNAIEVSSRFGALKPLDSLVRFAERLRQRSRRSDYETSTGTVRDRAMKSAHQSQALISASAQGTGELQVAPDDTDPRFSPDNRDMAMSRFSRTVMNSVALDRLAAARRRNFAHLAERLSTSPLGRPLWDATQAPPVPYVFPFLLDRPERSHPPMIAARLPVWRWDQLLVSGVCERTDAWRYRLIQLPCHQGLTPERLDRLVEAIHEVAA
jgi:perosamine synthetase